MLSSLINQQFGRYVITAILGRGGMAAVYRAHDALLQRDVAIKVLYPHYADEGAFVERFKQEAVTVAALEHPHIATIYDVGEQNGTVYIAMKLLSGHTLQDTLNARGTLTLDDLLPILDHVASALDYAHAHGIVHRDIKPGNIMLDIPADAVATHQMTQTHAILTDFGIAKNLDTTGLTTTGALIGTPDYMAPEQIGNRQVDGRTDVYALAMVAYRALTGRPAFDGNTQNVLLAHLHEQAPPPSTFNPQLSPAVDAVLLKALAKDPDQRYASAGQFVQALRLAPSSLITAAATAAPRVAPPARRLAVTTSATPPAPAASPRPVSSWLAASLLVILLILVGVLAAMLFDGGANNSGENHTAATNPQGGIGLLATETATVTPAETSATAVIFPTGEETAIPTSEPTALPNVTATSAITEEPPPLVTPAQPLPPVTAAPPTAEPTPVEPDPPPTTPPSDTPEPTAPPTDTLEPTALACDEEFFAGGFELLWDQNVAVRTAMGCPTEPLDPGRAVVQFFEGGTMYWWGETDTIYVFFGVTEGRYRVVGPVELGTYAEPTPDPSNPNAPVRGFGRVYAGIPEVQEALGAVRTPEIDLNEPNRQGVRQRFDDGHMLFIPAGINPASPSKLIFVLGNDETFTRYIDTYVD